MGVLYASILLVATVVMVVVFSQATGHVNAGLEAGLEDVEVTQPLLIGLENEKESVYQTDAHLGRQLLSFHRAVYRPTRQYRMGSRWRKMMENVGPRTQKPLARKAKEIIVDEALENEREDIAQNMDEADILLTEDNIEMLSEGKAKKSKIPKKKVKVPDVIDEEDSSEGREDMESLKESNNENKVKRTQKTSVKKTAPSLNGPEKGKLYSEMEDSLEDGLDEAETTAKKVPSRRNEGGKVKKLYSEIEDSLGDGTDETETTAKKVPSKRNEGEKVKKSETLISKERGINKTTSVVKRIIGAGTKNNKTVKKDGTHQEAVSDLLIDDESQGDSSKSTSPRNKIKDASATKSNKAEKKYATDKDKRIELLADEEWQGEDAEDIQAKKKKKKEVKGEYGDLSELDNVELDNKENMKNAILNGRLKKENITKKVTAADITSGNKPTKSEKSFSIQGKIKNGTELKTKNDKQDAKLSEKASEKKLEIKKDKQVPQTKGIQTSEKEVQKKKIQQAKTGETEVKNNLLNKEATRSAGKEKVQVKKESKWQEDMDASKVAIKQANPSVDVLAQDDDELDFVQEFGALPTKLQETAGQVAEQLRPEIERISNKSKDYLAFANQHITRGILPLLGEQLAPLVASVISYGLLLMPLMLVLYLFENIRAMLSIQKILLIINLYLTVYFAMLVLASLLIGSDIMAFFYKISPSSCTFLQLLQAFGYIFYLVIQSVDLVASCSNEALAMRFRAVFQWIIVLLFGLHYYVAAFHKIMARKMPRTSWKVYGIYSLIFGVLYFLTRLERSKKEYVAADGDEATDKKN